MPSTAITVIDGKPVTLEALLERSKVEIQKVLPLHIPVDRFVRVAITTVRKSEQLQACDAISIVGCIMEAAQLGLEISGVLGHAYMVPYAREAQLQIGYRGFVALANNSDKVDWCDGKVVYEGDEFDYQFGTEPYIRHVPCGESDFVKVTHAYFITKLASGSAIFNVWTRGKIEAHRDRYSPGAKSDKESAWDIAEEPMFIKTVARPTLKFAPISNSLTRAISLDEMAEVGIPQQLAKDIASSVISGEKIEAPEDIGAEVTTIAHNRDEYPARGKHSENGKEPKTWRNIPPDYLEWAIRTVKKGEVLRERAIAELSARRSKEPASETTDAEFENGTAPPEINELAELLKCPALTQEFTDSLSKEAESSPHDLAWYRDQIVIVKEMIADKEKDDA